nr:putative disease resistance RPP13-like protein 3 [Ipomoea batatas]
MAHVAVTSLLRTIELEFFQSQPRPLPQHQKQIITDCTDLIESLRESLRFVQSSLEELQGLDAKGHEKLPRDLGAKLRDFALNAEDGIESELSHIYLAEPVPGELVPSSEEPQPPSPARLRQVLQRAVEDIDRIKEDLTSIKDNLDKIDEAGYNDFLRTCLLQLEKSSSPVKTKLSSSSPVLQLEKTTASSLIHCRSFLYFEEDKEAIKLMKRGIFKPTLGSRKHISDLLQVSSNLKLLRVLEMSSFECLEELGSLSSWIADLVHLRHLSLIIGFPLTNLPISKARNLHTLRISAGYQGMKDPFPPFILDELPQLRYLKCWPSCELFPPTFVHENLHSVSSISPVQCLQEVFAKIPKLRKLSITGERFYFILYGDNLAFLPQLESLSIDFQSVNAFQRIHTPTSSVDNIASLHGLKKLKLMCTEILWKDVNLLAKLPKLEVLKLIFQACVGREWKLEDEEEEYVFCSLKYLFIDYSSLVEWEATNVNFPVLERLLLSRCFNLKEIPSDFEDITTLQLIEIMGCLSSVEDSAREIEKGQRDSGNDMIQVALSYCIVDYFYFPFLTKLLMSETSDPNEEGPSREEEDS